MNDKKIYKVTIGTNIKVDYPSTEGKTAQQIAKERIDQVFKDVKPNHYY